MDNDNGEPTVDPLTVEIDLETEEDCVLGINR
jgi:hypothetical protein